MENTKEILLKIPLIKQLIIVLDNVKLPWLNGLSFYELIEFYLVGVLQGGISYRAAAIAFSFFMALFPFALFILNLIPYIPIKGFQNDFLLFVRDNVPPTTFDAIENIIKDILNNSQTGLLSWGVFLSVFLMTNGVNAVMSGFETSLHISVKRPYFRQYFVALLISLMLTTILIITISAIIFLEIIIQKTIIQDVLSSRVSDKISLIELGRYTFVVIMILLATAILFKYGIKQSKKKRLITIGTVFTTGLIVVSSYFFGIWVVKFSKYNELYGSIGTLLVFLFYLWINCMVLLLGFELDASIRKLKKIK
ncbi:MULTISPECIES: YihY/virulence factor BrkB family protein [Flavobacterium]|uniref:YihY/virulence factor BrkB family protein n=2 Tax=Flavobacterium TaxID=237 RepID=A0AA94F1T0_9FLAO|nr:MULTISPECIES: YihY/virulence factor BrkB family protein [Flavobacterium]OXA79288.1 ribonuclease BN [Flavobacterium columnare] [Flavobacterium columnare NBRC 100251 = ATCC 23463]AMA49094.1 ribonuclease BN [Flavobacterium covae]AND64833.1 ribonuclease BN [Flavobacterium covae]MCH4831025.1 YihY/virulence factor BrkB family protein [Flavobacterium columnare]MCH4833033.1 YihY/virulence factor BrkB family protein [Flavobacterium columnare]